LGYFKNINVKLEAFRDGYKVIFVLEEYLPVDEIIIEGSTTVTVEEMRDVMVLTEGQIFSQKILKKRT